MKERKMERFKAIVEFADNYAQEIYPIPLSREQDFNKRKREIIFPVIIEYLMQKPWNETKKILREKNE